MEPRSTERGQAKLADALKGKTAYTTKRIEAHDATAPREKAFKRLDEAIEEVVIISKIVLEVRPQLLQKMGLLVYSEGYTTESRSTTEEPKPELQSDPITEVTATEPDTKSDTFDEPANLSPKPAEEVHPAFRRIKYKNHWLIPLNECIKMQSYLAPNPGTWSYLGMNCKLIE